MKFRKVGNAFLCSMQFCTLNQTLSLYETKKFVTKILENSPNGYTDKEFEICFNEFDTDNSGTIEKIEMVNFIKRVSKLDF